MPDAASHPSAEEGGVPPRLSVSKTNTRVWLFLWGAVLLGCGALLFFFNPAHHSFYPRCAFHQLTGWQCPGCGGLRAAHQLLHGHVTEALRLNVLAVLAIPLAAWWVWRRRVHGRGRVRAGWLWWMLVVLVVFGVLRNLPGFGWFSP